MKVKSVIGRAIFICGAASVFHAGAQAACMTDDQIMQELQKAATENNYGAITKRSPVLTVGVSGPESWRALDARFNSCGLALGANDLRTVRTVGQLIGLIKGGLTRSDTPEVQERLLEQAVERSQQECAALGDQGQEKLTSYQYVGSSKACSCYRGTFFCNY